MYIVFFIAHLLNVEERLYSSFNCQVKQFILGALHICFLILGLTFLVLDFGHDVTGLLKRKAYLMVNFLPWTNEGNKML